MQFALKYGGILYGCILHNARNSIKSVTVMQYWSYRLGYSVSLFLTFCRYTLYYWWRTRSDKCQQLHVISSHKGIIIKRKEDRTELFPISQQWQCQNVEFACKVTKTLFENFVECKIWCSHRGAAEDSKLQECYTASLDEQSPKFWRIML